MRRIPATGSACFLALFVLNPRFPECGPPSGNSRSSCPSRFLNTSCATLLPFPVPIGRHAPRLTFIPADVYSGWRELPAVECPGWRVFWPSCLPAGGNFRPVCAPACRGRERFRSGNLFFEQERRFGFFRIFATQRFAGAPLGAAKAMKRECSENLRQYPLL